MPILLVVVLAILLIAMLMIRDRVAAGGFWPWGAAPMKSHDYIGTVRQMEDEVTRAVDDKSPTDLAP